MKREDCFVTSVLVIPSTCWCYLCAISGCLFCCINVAMIKVSATLRLLVSVIMYNQSREMGYEMQYCNKRHTAPLENCFSWKLSCDAETTRVIFFQCWKNVTLPQEPVNSNNCFSFWSFLLLIFWYLFVWICTQQFTVTLIVKALSLFYK